MAVETGDDDDLLAALGAALRDAAVPETVVAAAKGAYTWRTVDAELAALSYDSAVGAVGETLGEALEGAGAATERVGVTFRSGMAMPRELSFTGPTLGIELEIDDGGLRGQLLPPQAARLLLVAAHGEEHEAAADAMGRFHLTPLPPGPHRLRCAVAGRPPVVTDWFAR